jgi:hypothetical protein
MGISIDASMLKDSAIVLVHNVNEDTPLRREFSLFDVVNHSLYQVNNNAVHERLGESDLFTTPMEGREVMLTNSLVDQYKIHTALALASASKRGGLPAIRRMGVIALRADSNKNESQYGFDYSLTDVESLMPQVYALLRKSRLYEHLGDNLRSLADNASLWDPTRYRQSLLDSLQMIAKSEMEVASGKTKDSWDEIYRITIDHLDPLKSSHSMKLNTAIRRRMNYMKNVEYLGHEKALYANPVYILLAQAAEQSSSPMDLGHLFFKARNKLWRMWESPNNFFEPILAHWKDQMNKAMFQSNREMQEVVQFTNSLVDKQRQIKHITKTDAFFSPDAHKLFHRWFKRRQFTSRDGTITSEMNVYELHYSEADEDTKKAMLAGHIRSEELAIARQFLDKIEEYLIKAIQNQIYIDGKRRTVAEAREYLFDRLLYVRGTLPAMSTSFAEALAKVISGEATGQEKMELLQKAIVGSSLTEYGLFETIDAGDEVADEQLGNIMLMQIMDEKKRLFRLGLKKEQDKDGNFKLYVDGQDGLLRNRSLSENLQSITNYTAALSTRVEAFLTHFVDTHKNVLGMLNSTTHSTNRTEQLMVDERQIHIVGFKHESLKDSRRF